MGKLVRAELEAKRLCDAFCLITDYVRDSLSPENYHQYTLMPPGDRRGANFGEIESLCQMEADVRERSRLDLERIRLLKLHWKVRADAHLADYLARLAP